MAVRADLAIDLVRALFCGLPRREHRMAVFVCCADESIDQNPRGNFFYGGFSGPVNDWDGVFADAWNERILNGPPQIPYLHMTSIRSRDWREEHNISVFEAEARLDEASRVIGSMGSLIPVTFSIDERVFNQIVKPLPFLPAQGQKTTIEPDYICFVWFAFTQLKWIHGAYPDVERVDFWVEQNGKITKHINGFHKRLADNLLSINHPELAGLVGEFHAVGKDRIPAQAADMLGWHTRNLMKGALDAVGQRRYWRMTDGGFNILGRGRYGHRSDMDVDILRQLAENLDKRRQEEETVIAASASADAV